MPTSPIGLAAFTSTRDFGRRGQGGELAIESGEAHGMRGLLNQNHIYGFGYDTGNTETLARAKSTRVRCAQHPGKTNEDIWFVDGQVMVPPMTRSSSTIVSSALHEFKALSLR